MKKILVVFLLIFSSYAQANSQWVWPLVGGLVGGVIIGEVAAQPRYPYGYYPQPMYAPPPVYYQPPPVYYQPAPMYYQEYYRNEYYREMANRRLQGYR